MGGGVVWGSEGRSGGKPSYFPEKLGEVEGFNRVVVFPEGEREATTVTRGSGEIQLVTIVVKILSSFREKAGVSVTISLGRTNVTEPVAVVVKLLLKEEVNTTLGLGKKENVKEKQ